MMNLLVLREHIKTFFQKYDSYVKPVLKFILAFITFFLINHALGYDERLNKIVVVFILSLIGALSPMVIFVLIAAALVIMHVFFISKILSVITILLLFIIYFLFIRLTPKQGIILLILPILFLLKIPYLIPILLGLMYTPIVIVPVTCGTILYYFLQIVDQVAVANMNSGLEDTLQLYTYVMDSLLQNKIMILTIVIFAFVIIATYIVRRRDFDHAFNIAVLVGGITNILGFLIGYLKLDISDQIISMILGTICSTAIVYAIQFFRLALDYTAIEHVQFEDDDYYYYVKAVPKMNVTTPQKSVKRINPQKLTEQSEEIKEDKMRKSLDSEITNDYGESD